MKLDNMEIVILDSALKHGVSEASILSCVLNMRGKMMLQNEPLPKFLVAGFDHIGNALEIVALEDDNNETLTVIHAMKLRKQFQFLLGGN